MRLDWKSYQNRSSKLWAVVNSCCEAIALRDGIKVATQFDFNRLCIEGDNHTVIQTLQGKISISWKISTILEDVRTWIQQVTHVQVNHIFRAANMAADWIFKFGHTVTDCFSSDDCFFPALGAILAADIVGYTLVKRCT